MEKSVDTTCSKALHVEKINHPFLETDYYYLELFGISYIFQDIFHFTPFSNFCFLP